MNSTIVNALSQFAQKAVSEMPRFAGMLGLSEESFRDKLPLAGLVLASAAVLIVGAKIIWSRTVSSGDAAERRAGGAVAARKREAGGAGDDYVPAGKREVGSEGAGAGAEESEPEAEERDPAAAVPAGKREVGAGGAGAAGMDDNNISRQIDSIIVNPRNKHGAIAAERFMPEDEGLYARHSIEDMRAKHGEVHKLIRTLERRHSGDTEGQWTVQLKALQFHARRIELMLQAKEAGFEKYEAFMLMYKMFNNEAYMDDRGRLFDRLNEDAKARNFFVQRLIGSEPKELLSLILNLGDMAEEGNFDKFHSMMKLLDDDTRTKVIRVFLNVTKSQDAKSIVSDEKHGNISNFFRLIGKIAIPDNKLKEEIRAEELRFYEIARHYIVPDDSDSYDDWVEGVSGEEDLSDDER